MPEIGASERARKALQDRSNSGAAGNGLKVRGDYWGLLGWWGLFPRSWGLFPICVGTVPPLVPRMGTVWGLFPTNLRDRVGVPRPWGLYQKGRGPTLSDDDYRTRSWLRLGAGHRVGIQNLPAGGPPTADRRPPCPPK